MERYLVFDSGCATCSHLATTVRDATSGKLQPLSIHDARAQALLDQARPGGWNPAPYLVVIAEGRVRAWTGTASAVRLAALAGPRGAWRIWAAARRQGIYLPPGPAPAVVRGLSRRSFLKLAAGTSAALVALGLLPAKSAFACEICSDTSVGGCGYSYAFISNCNYAGSGCSGGYGVWWCSLYDRYDARTGEYCDRVYEDCCCTGTVFCGSSNPNYGCGSCNPC